MAMNLFFSRYYYAALQSFWKQMMPVTPLAGSRSHHYWLLHYSRHQDMNEHG